MPKSPSRSQERRAKKQAPVAVVSDAPTEAVVSSPAETTTTPVTSKGHTKQKAEKRPLGPLQSVCLDPFFKTLDEAIQVRLYNDLKSKDPRRRTAVFAEFKGLKEASVIDITEPMPEVATEETPPVKPPRRKLVAKRVSV